MDEENGASLEDDERPTRKKKKDELELFNERIKEGKCKLNRKNVLSYNYFLYGLASQVLLQTRNKVKNSMFI